MKKRGIAVVLLGLLSACASNQPTQTLSQKLEGKTPEQRREVLRLACLNEAEYSTDLSKARYRRQYGSKRIEQVRDTKDTAELKTLCREMTDSYAGEK